MIIDINTYSGNWPYRNLGIKDFGELTKSLKKKGINKAVVTPMEAIFLKNTSAFYHDFFLNIKPYQKSIPPLLVINPLWSWQELLSSFQKKIFGIALCPRFHHYSLNSPFLLSFLTEMRNKKLPVFISLRIMDERTVPLMLSLSRPASVKELLQLPKAFPSLKFVFTGISTGEFKELQNIKPENIFVDTSFIEGEDIWENIEKEWLSHILFGSNFPFFYLEAGIDKIRKSSLSNFNQRKIFSRNIELLK